MADIINEKNQKQEYNKEDFPVFFKGASSYVFPAIGGGIEEIATITEVWRGADYEAKKAMAETWENVFKWAAEIAAKHNLVFGRLFGKPSEDDFVCETCHGTGFYLRWEIAPPAERECPECRGTGYQISRCNRCGGTGDNGECPTCRGTGFFIYWKRPCKVCGIVSPSGNRIRGIGKIYIPQRRVKFITTCSKCGGWGSRHITKNPFMSEGVLTARPRIKTEMETETD